MRQCMNDGDGRTDRLKRRSFVRSSELRLRAHSCHSQLPRPRVLLPRSRVLDEACRHRCSALYLSIYGNSSLPLCLPVCPPRLKTRRPTLTHRPRSQTTSSPPSPPAGPHPGLGLNHRPPRGPLTRSVPCSSSPPSFTR